MLWQGACEISNSTYGGMPKAYYEYSYEVSNRTTTSVHLKLEVAVRMLNPWNYYSFGLAHSCKVGVGTREEVLANAPITKTYLKTNRKWWGHANTWVQNRATYENKDSDYDGTTWHRFTVYDADVPVEPTATGLTVIACIWQQCLCKQTPYNASNPLSIDPEETCNWPDNYGIWVPWEYDGQRGLAEGYYANRRVPWGNGSGTGCGTFLNNRNYQVLQFDGDTIPIPPYPYTKAPKRVSITPLQIDEEQSNVNVTATWDAVDDAQSYAVIVHMGDRSIERTVYGTSFTFNPKELFGLESLHGCSFHVEVYAVDKNGARSLNSASSPVMSYIDHLPPNKPKSVSLTPIAVDVASNTDLTCTWKPPVPVGNVPEATGAVYYEIRVESVEFVKESTVSGEKATINPRNIGIPIEDERPVTVFVRSVDKYGYKSDWAVSNTIVFTKAPTYSADTFTLVGMRGTDNQILFTGEECKVNATGEVQGSYKIAFKRVVVLSNGRSFDVGTNNYVKINPGLEPATTALVQLQSFYEDGSPVYNRNGEWATVEVLFYGGLVWVYDNGWKLGWLYVYDGEWKEAMAANIYNGGWR